MADSDASLNCASDISDISGLHQNETFGLHMRKKNATFKESGDTTTYEADAMASEDRAPESLGSLSLASGQGAEGTSAQSSDGGISLFSYVYAELTRGYLLEKDEAKLTEKQKRVYNFMHIPKELEKFMFYGLFQCADTFLYTFTFLPIRFLMALIKLCVRGCLYSCFGNKDRRILESAQICDLLKGFVLVVCCVMMNYVDVSMMYHMIRGQAIIKLYLFYNMLEVADRLFSSFGQDTLDSLFWTAAQTRNRKREHFGTIPQLFIVVLYVFLHAILVLFQATTLNVAFNSHNKALLTIMMSNNFVELKGSVFKKFEKANLFQMSCSDVRERFHLIVLLAIVCVRNLTEFSWSMNHLFLLVPDCLFVLFVEILVDAVKHAFITKFNEIPLEVYHEYTVSIAYDMCQSRHSNAFADHVDVVSRRMGFTPLPLAVVLVRVVSHSFHVSLWFDAILVILIYFCFMTLKILISIVLLGRSVQLINANKEAKQATKKQQQQQHKTSSAPSSPVKEASKFKRSKSVGEDLSTMLNTLRQQASAASVPTPNVELQTQSSLSSKPMFSNSTVSLASVGLNEDFVSDSTRESSPAAVAGIEIKSKKPPPKPLNEVDRYTMCSNRII